MFTHLRVSNFQVVEKADIPLGRLTVLTGPGRSGKSSLVRALRSLLLNSGKDGFIRHGAKAMQVQLETEEGTSIHWAKAKNKGGEYTLIQDGVTDLYSKTGAVAPPEVIAATKVVKMEIDKNTPLYPQVQNQMGDDTFIIGETGSKQARILGALTHLDTVIRAQMECTKRAKGYDRTASTAKEQVETLGAQVKSIPDVGHWVNELDTMYQNVELIDKAVRSIEQAEEHVATLEGIKTTPDPSALEQIITEAGPLVEAWSVAHAAVRAHQRYATQMDIALPLQELEGAISEADGLVGHVIQVDRAIQNYRSRKQELAIYAEQRTDTDRDAAHAQEVYENACADAGICQKCGGLLDHTECTS